MAGLAELHDWVAYEDKEWVCRPEEAEAALERITQAARYLVQARLAGWRGRPCVWGNGARRRAAEPAAEGLLACRHINGACPRRTPIHPRAARRARRTARARRRIAAWTSQPT